MAEESIGYSVCVARHARLEVFTYIHICSSSLRMRKELAGILSGKGYGVGTKRIQLEQCMCLLHMVLLKGFDHHPLLLYHSQRFT